MKLLPLLLPLLIIAAPVRAETIVINASEYGDEWPFFVERVELSCSNVAAVLMTVNGKTYSLNAKAGSQFKQLPNWRDIAKPHPKYGSGAMMTPPLNMIERGLALCPK